MEYNGLEIKAHKDLHSQIIKQLEILKINKNSSILVLGAGSGALDSRLYDNNYQNITSVDIDYSSYKFDKTKINKFLQIDLNSSFSKIINEQFDLIISVEIIEHLYSPYYFLYESKKLLKKGASMIITTPNLSGIFSRISNLIFGYPIYFVFKPEKYGHISPIFINIFEHYIERLGMEIVFHKTECNFLSDFKIVSFQAFLIYGIFILLFPLFAIFSLFNRKYLYGSFNIFLIKNKYE